jgi:FkbM family methyltransferase
LLDDASECYSQNLLCSLAADLYPGHAMQTNDVRVINTQALRGDSEFLLSKPENLYLDSLRHPDRISNFLRQSYGVKARHPSLGPPLAKRGSYGRGEEELASIFRLEHPLWVRKRELAAMPANAEFYSDQPDSARAQRWRRKQGPVGEPPPVPPITRLRWATQPLRQKLGLGKSGILYRAAAAPVRWWRARARQQPQARWREWRRHPSLHFETPESRQLEVLELLAAALNELRGESVVFVDVGAALGEVRDLFQSKSGLHKSVFSIGIDPVDVRDHWSYNGYVTGAVSSGPAGTAEFFRYSSSDCSSLKRMEPSSISHDPADIAQGKYFTPVVVERLEETLRVPTFRLDTLVRQYGLAHEVLHFVKIDAQGSDLDVFRSLGELTRNCLFLRIETVIPRAGMPTRLLYEGQTTFAEDRKEIEAAGFRLFNISHFGVTPEADVTFVNLKLLRELLPGWAT